MCNEQGLRVRSVTARSGFNFGQNTSVSESVYSVPSRMVPWNDPLWENQTASEEDSIRIPHSNPEVEAVQGLESVDPLGITRSKPGTNPSLGESIFILGHEEGKLSGLTTLYSGPHLTERPFLIWSDFEPDHIDLVGTC